MPESIIECHVHVSAPKACWAYKGGLARRQHELALIFSEDHADVESSFGPDVGNPGDPAWQAA